MLSLDKTTLPFIQSNKNLLAFSAGVDSSALFFLLIEQGISFDIALVNYGLREESIHEENYALSLGKKYNLKVYIQKAPDFQNNFEKNARDFRYTFFDELMKKHGYSNLLTAHQLNDQLEWFLMRLTKGAGTSELLGLVPVSQRKNYSLIRPLLHHSKDELLEYLSENSHHYFIDKSNNDEKYERNLFRNRFSDKLIKEYSNGIKKSFSYLQEDKEYLTRGYSELFHYKELYILKIEHRQVLVRAVDSYLKKLGYLLSSRQRTQLKQETSVVIAGLWAIEIVESLESEALAPNTRLKPSFPKIVYIAPYIKEVMPKKFKEVCRVAKIPSKVRGYFYKEGIEPKMALQL